MVSIMNRVLFDLIFCMTAVRRKFLSSSWSGQQLVRLFFSRRRRPSVVLPLFFLVMQRKAEEEEEAKKVFPYFPSPSPFLGPNPNSCLFPLSLSPSARSHVSLPPPCFADLRCRVGLELGEERDAFDFLLLHTAIRSKQRVLVPV